MLENVHTFRYTAQRSSYLSIAGVFAFLFVVEGGGSLLLVMLLISMLWLKLTILVVTLGFYCAIFMLLLAPLRTKHRLSDTHLHLNYGLLFHVNIALEEISEAQAMRKISSRIQPASANYEAKRQRIVACFSDKGLVLLTLQRPLDLKIGLRKRQTTNILLNLDQREAFLEALATAKSALVDKLPANPSPLRSSHDQYEVPSFSSPEATSSIPPRLDPITTQSGTIAIQLENVTRRFHAFTAVDSLSMTIRQGEIYGLLGSNGAGKSTIIRMLVGLVQPDAGQIKIMGHDVWQEPLAVKMRLGYVADRALLYERLTGREFLEFLAQLRGLSKTAANARINFLLTLLELAEHADRLCGTYSFGMKRKLSLAGALLHEPEILLLDEPLNGLDPRSARRIKDLFLELAARGTTIVLSTHDLATAETVCHRVGIFHRGRLLAEGNAEELRQLASAPNLETVFLNLTGEQRLSEEVQV